MPFYGNSFIFDGVPSEFYNLYLGQVGGEGESTITGSDVSLLTQKIFRRPAPFLYGVEQTPVLSFPLHVYSEDEISLPHYSKIAGWLFANQNYKVLRICQEDMQDVYFNAFFTSPEIIRIGNIIKAFTTNVICDSPFGYREPKTYSYSGYDGVSMSDTFEIFNESANIFYSYPQSLTITANIYGGSVTITNVTDNNRQFIFLLSPNEVITLNNDLQTVISSVETYPLSHFNKNWLRMLKGNNVFTITGNISSFSITTSPIEVKIG